MSYVCQNQGNKIMSGITLRRAMQNFQYCWEILNIDLWNILSYKPGTSQLSGQTGKNPLPHHEAYVKSSLALNTLQTSCSNFPKISFGKLKVILTPFLGYGNCHKSSMLILIEKVSKSGEIFFALFWWFLEQCLHHFRAVQQFWTLLDMCSMKS